MEIFFKKDTIENRKKKLLEEYKTKGEWKKKFAWFPKLCIGPDDTKVLVWLGYYYTKYAYFEAFLHYHYTEMCPEFGQSELSYRMNQAEASKLNKPFRYFHKFEKYNVTPTWFI